MLGESADTVPPMSFRGEAVGISWGLVQIPTPYQEIATGLMALAILTGTPTTINESLLPPPQGEGAHAVVEGVCLRG